MCGRFDNLIADVYCGLFKANRLPKSNFPLRYNVAPTDQIPIVRIDPRDGEREVVMARWGLIPFWMKEKPKVPHINARAKTVDRLPLFREAFAKWRCLIPATEARGPIASVAKTLSRLRSQEYGNLPAPAVRSFSRRISQHKDTKLGFLIDRQILEDKFVDLLLSTAFVGQNEAGKG